MPGLNVSYLTLKQHADNGMLKNIGDRVIYLGVRNIMRCALGEHNERICFLDGSDPLPADTDIAVVCGMPQLLNARPSALIERIAEVAACDVPVKLNLGVGAFYFDAFGDDRAQKDDAFVERLKKHPGTELYRKYVGFDLCTCRDMAGAKALREFGVAAAPLPCPGFFSALFEPRPLVRRTNQLVSVLNGTAGFWNSVKGDIHGFYRRLWDADKDRLFIAHDEQDCTMLADLDIPYMTFNNAEDFIQFLASSQQILSLRVHGALPAWTLGLDVTLLGIDRRALLGEDFGARMRIIPIRTEEDLLCAEKTTSDGMPLQNDDIRREWLLRHLADYVSRIRSVVSAKLNVRFEGGATDLLGGRLHREEEARRAYTASGKYFSTLFHSTERAFPVPLDKLRSSHNVDISSAGLAVTLNGKHSTIAFGPYIRVPKAKWRASANISIIGSTERPAKLEFIVSKGIPGVPLGRHVAEIGVCENRCELEIDIICDNPSDTGEIETIIKTHPALPEGTKVLISGFTLERL